MHLRQTYLPEHQGEGGDLRTGRPGGHIAATTDASSSTTNRKPETAENKYGMNIKQLHPKARRPV